MSLPGVGDLFEGRYRIDEVLGEGGFATVFAAQDQAGRRRVALKILKPEKGSYPEEVASRFVREVRVVANLQDPHTVTMYDSGRSSRGLLYMVFEHVAGVDLSQLIAQRGALGEVDTVHVITQVLRSLREAHRAGLLHRDIKPENIRIYEYAGDPLRVKLLDFGIAKPSHAKETRITRPGELIGTPRYMSPEQLLERELSPASDLYSLGLVTLEMLLGRELLHGNSWSDQLARLKAGHSFDTTDAPISPLLRNVVARMSAREVDQRYQSADEVLRDLGVGVSTDSLLIAQLVPERQVPTPLPGPPPTAAPAPLELATTRKRRAPPSPVARRRFHVLAISSVAALVLAVALVALLTRKLVAPAEPTAETPPSVIAPRLPPSPPVAPPPVEPVAVAAPEADMHAEDDVSQGRTPGCGRPMKQGHGLVTLREVDGLDTLQWTVYIPRSYDPDRAHAAMFLFRDAGQQPDYLVREAGFDRIADEHDVVLIAPPGREHFDGTGIWTRIWEEDDVMDHIRDAWFVASDALCLDPSRVFAVGHGAGGYAAERMACDFRVAAIATNAHVKLPEDPFCVPEKPVPYIVLLGDQDGYVPKEGGLNCAMTRVRKLSWKQKQERWKKPNRCEGPPKKWGAVTRGGTCQTWACEVPFVFCELDGGREWPGARAPIWDKFNSDCGGYPSNFPSVPAIWQFFSQVPPRVE